MSLATWLLVALLVLGPSAMSMALYLRRRRKDPRRRRIFMGRDAARFTKGQEILVRDTPRAKDSVRVTAVDARKGFVEVEKVPPPTAASRQANPQEAALLVALGFDPKTHDLAPVFSPHKGVQVLRDGERVRFFTEKQVKGLAGKWKTALRAGAGA